MDAIKEHREFNPRKDDGIGESSISRESKDRFGPICTCGGMASSDMMMTVAIDNEKPRSSTVGGIGTKSDGSNTQSESVINTAGGKKGTNSAWLESSFVHLMTPRNDIRTTKTYQEGLHHQASGTKFVQHGFLERHQHMLQLLDAAYTNIDGIEHITNNSNCDFTNRHKSPCGGVELCTDCIDRVASALDADTQRLYAEAEAYKETVRVSKEQLKALQRTTRCVTSVGIGANLALEQSDPEDPTKINSNINNNINNSSEDLVNNHTIEKAYRDEILMLEREIEARYDELLQYKSIYEEQTKISEELCKFEEGLQLKENSIELQSESFDNRRQVLTKTLAEVQNEVDKLSCVSLPRILFDLQVDQARGLHYPLINQLRLAFRPKGDVPAQEIQVAWSQATQLLLILGTLLKYPGKDWKLVPLADCAKLIYRKEVFNLVPGDCRSLMAWNALLDQVVKHALSLVAGGSRDSSISVTKNAKVSPSLRTNDTFPLNKPVPPPYSSSPTTIGNTELARLDRTDDVGWSQVIHRMASNLLWLSNRASSLSATQVSTLAHCVI